MPDFFAATAPGLESLTAAELRALGIEAQQAEPGGVSFSGDLDTLYRANLELRTASRVTMRLATFTARTWHELERHAGKAPWKDVLAPGAAPDFEVTSRKSRLYHLRGIAERLSNWLGTPSEGPQQRFIVRVVRDRFMISADSSGELLHRRGYRQETSKAPMRETLAAAMLLAAGWQGEQPLLDPFCGSGTLPIEAALLARRIAPGLERGFAFEQWPVHQAETWRRLVDTARTRVLPHATTVIKGSDRDAGAINAARANAGRAGVAADVAFEQVALSAAPSPAEGAAILANPPYGSRVGGPDLRDLYAQVGNVARRNGAGMVGLLVADPHLAAQARLDFEERFRTTNGGIDVRFLVAPVGILATGSHED